MQIDYMRKFRKLPILLVLFAPLLMGFCIRQQGVKGSVLIEKDAAMPLKGKSKHTGSPFSTIVYVYSAANTNQLIGQQGNWAKGIQAKLIKQVQADKNGQFKIRLRPGKYTLVLKYKDGSYIPFFSGINGVAHIEVEKYQFQEIDLTIIDSSVF